MRLPRPGAGQPHDVTKRNAGGEKCVPLAARAWQAWFCGGGASRVGKPLVLAGLLLRNALEERDDVLLGTLQGA